MSLSYCEWELIDSGSIQHNYNVMKALPGINASQAALTPLRQAAMGSSVLVTIADKSGQTYTGRITSLTWEAIPGSSLYKAALQLSFADFTLTVCGVSYVGKVTVPDDQDGCFTAEDKDLLRVEAARAYIDAHEIRNYPV